MSLVKSFIGKTVMSALPKNLLKSNILFAIEVSPETDQSKALEALKRHIRQNLGGDLLVIVVKQ